MLAYKDSKTGTWFVKFYAVNASVEDCEEQDDDADIMQAEETAPMIDMDAATEKIISIDKYKAV